MIRKCSTDLETQQQQNSVSRALAIVFLYSYSRYNQYDLVFSGVDLRGHPLCVLDLRLLLYPVLLDWSVTELCQEVQDSHRLPRVRVPGDGLRKVYGQSTGRCSVK